MSERICSCLYTKTLCLNSNYVKNNFTLKWDVKI